MYQKPYLSQAFLMIFLGLSTLLNAGWADTTSSHLDVMTLSDSLEVEFGRIMVCGECDGGLP
jgi:hypothetical protein